MLAALFVLVFAPHALGQRVSTVSSSGVVLDREREYSLLAEEAEFFERQSRLLRRIVRISRPTVVHISAVSANDSGLRGRSVEEAGSGVVVKLNGSLYVLTNRHVIRHAVPRATADRGIGEIRTISIELADHRVVYPTRVLEHRNTDVAVMQIPSTLPDVEPARIGDSDLLDVGDFVIAIGSPFALSQSVTFGHVSAVGRRDLDLGEQIPIQEFLQIDAAINPGNSGGPLINVRGEVVGLNTAIASSSGGSEGVGFAIPINIAILVAEQLVTKGVVEESFLGVSMERHFGPDIAASLGLSRPQGVLVTEVRERSPAARSGLRPKDVILEFNGRVVQDDDHLLNLVRLTPAGKPVPLIVFRDGQAIPLGVTLERYRGD